MDHLHILWTNDQVETGELMTRLLKDNENKRRTEVDFINGKIVKYGKRVGMDTR